MTRDWDHPRPEGAQKAPPPPPDDFSGGGPTLDEYTLYRMNAAVDGRSLSIRELEAIHRVGTQDIRLRYRVLLWTNAAALLLVVFLLVRM